MTLQYKLIAALVAVALSFAAGWTVNGWRKDEQISQIKQDHLQAYTDNLQAAADKTYQLQQKKDEALNGYISRQSVLLADARSARSESARLRDQINAIRSNLPDLADEAIRRYADTLGVVFNECQERYTAVAEDADRSRNATQALSDAWPK